MRVAYREDTIVQKQRSSAFSRKRQEWKDLDLSEEVSLPPQVFHSRGSRVPTSLPSSWGMVWEVQAESHTQSFTCLTNGTGFQESGLWKIAGPDTAAVIATLRRVKQGDEEYQVY